MYTASSRDVMRKGENELLFFSFHTGRVQQVLLSLREKKQRLLAKAWKYELFHLAENTFSQRRRTFGAYFSLLLAAQTFLHASDNTISKADD